MNYRITPLDPGAERTGKPSHGSRQDASAPEFRWAGKQLFLSGVVCSKAQAQDVLNFVTAMMPFLPQTEEPRR